MQAFSEEIGPVSIENVEIENQQIKIIQKILLHFWTIKIEIRKQIESWSILKSFDIQCINPRH